MRIDTDEYEYDAFVLDGGNYDEGEDFSCEEIFGDDNIVIFNTKEL